MSGGNEQQLYGASYTCSSVRGMVPKQLCGAVAMGHANSDVQPSNPAAQVGTSCLPELIPLTLQLLQLLLCRLK
jgi:hypothetical protein